MNDDGRDLQKAAQTGGGKTFGMRGRALYSRYANPHVGYFGLTRGGVNARKDNRAFPTLTQRDVRAAIAYASELARAVSAA